MKPKLEWPIRRALRSTPAASSIARVRAAVATRPLRARGRRAPAVVLALAAAAAIALAGVLGRPDGGERASALTAGARPLDVVVTTDQARTIECDDGSVIEVARGTTLRPRINDGSELVLELAAGRVELDVRPGGGRRWMIEAGWATVEVVGTRFSVSRSERAVDVEVERGEVVVRGEHVLGRVRHLERGQRLRVEAARGQEARATREAEIAPSVAEDTATGPGPAERSDDATAAPPAASTARAARSTAPGARLASPDAVAPMLARADEARGARRWDEAIALLEEIARDHAGDPRAAVAAFTLGRLFLDVEDRPEDAVRALDRAIELGLGAAMLEDARARRVEALARAGRAAEAADEAARFEREHPGSHRLADVRSWGTR